MKLQEFINNAQKHDDISSFGYYFNGFRDESADIEDFQITTKYLTLEDLKFDMDVEGEVIDGVFTFSDGDDTIGLEVWY